MIYILVALATFAVCFGIDKLYTKIFRSKAEHRSGRAVRLNKQYSIFGILLMVLGVIALLNASAENQVLFFGGIVVLLMGIGLLVYYLSFGIYYDEDTFLVTTFGNKSITYRYGEIRGQMLYVIQGGNVLVELHMTSGRAVSVQLAMDGAVAFLDHAYAAWLRQTGRDPRACDFHDTASYCWFPAVVTED